MNAMTSNFAAVEDTPAPMLGFFRSDSSRVLIATAFERPGLGEIMLTEGGLDVALKVMRRGEKPGLLVYDVGTSSNPTAEIATIVKHGGRALPVIAIGASIDVARFREFLAAGAFDYLDRELGPAAIAETVARARRQRTRHATVNGPARSGKVIVFCGSRGGVGTTSCAIATAWTLAHDCGVNTALLDLDLSFGTIAFALDIDPGRGLREGLEQPARIDSVFLERTLVRESERFAIFSAEEPCETRGEIDPAAATVLLDELRLGYDCIIVDLPRGLTPLNRAMLASADDIVLVTNATLAGLRDVIRWADFVPTVAERAIVRIVQGPTAPGAALPRAEFERNLGRTVDVVLPFDAKTAAVAANSGRAMPAVAPASPSTKAVAELAELLGFTTETPATSRTAIRWPWRKRHA